MSSRAGDVLWSNTAGNPKPYLCLRDLGEVVEVYDLERGQTLSLFKRDIFMLIENGTTRWENES